MRRSLDFTSIYVHIVAYVTVSLYGALYGKLYIKSYLQLPASSRVRCAYNAP